VPESVRSKVEDEHLKTMSENEHVKYVPKNEYEYDMHLHAEDTSKQHARCALKVNQSFFRMLSKLCPQMSTHTYIHTYHMIDIYITYI
jgi:hypothetical protein